MKNYLVLFLTLTLIACGPSQEEKEKIAAVACSVMRETPDEGGAIRIREMNAAREKIRGEPFLSGDDTIQEAFEYGLCEELILGSAIYDESKRIADSKPRTEIDFYPDGGLKASYTYTPKSEGGLLDGTAKEWYDNAKLKLEQNYKNGKLHGWGRLYHENGQLELETLWEDGKRQGLLRVWHKDGRLAGERCYSNEEQVAMSYCADWNKPTVKEDFHPNGKLKERINYQPKSEGGEIHGFWRQWWDNGQLRLENSYEDGKAQGVSRIWSETGQLRRETTYKDGKKHGLFRYWKFENGQLHIETTYKEGKIDGLYRLWDENGKLEFESCYSKDEEVSMRNCQG